MNAELLLLSIQYEYFELQLKIKCLRTHVYLDIFIVLYVELVSKFVRTFQLHMR
jgi:hypothetical protein